LERQWLTGAAMSGFDGPVSAMTVWHPPGGTPLLVFGGRFEVAGDLPAARIAAWDGTTSQFVPLGEGRPGEGVNALTIHNGELFAAGGFGEVYYVDHHTVARWDGAAWHPVGRMMAGEVLALASYRGDLIAA